MRGFFLSLFGMVFPQGSDTLQNEYIEDGVEVANDSLCEENGTLDNEYVEESIEASEYSFEDEDTPEDQDTPEDRDTHKDLDEENVKDIVDLPVNGMKVGVSFPTEQSALASLRKWMDKTFCPFIQVRSTKSLEESEGKTKGRRCFLCTHGRNRESQATNLRPRQHVKFTGCKVKFNC